MSMARFDVKVECRVCKWEVQFRGITNMEKVRAWYENHLDEVHPKEDEGKEVEVFIAR